MKAPGKGWSMRADKKQFHNLFHGYYPGFIFSARNVGPWGEMQIKYWTSTLQLGRMLFVFHDEELRRVLAIGELPGVKVRASLLSAQVSQEHRECLTQVTFPFDGPPGLSL